MAAYTFEELELTTGRKKNQSHSVGWAKTSGNRGFGSQQREELMSKVMLGGREWTYSTEGREDSGRASHRHTVMSGSSQTFLQGQWHSLFPTAALDHSAHTHTPHVCMPPLGGPAAAEGQLQLVTRPRRIPISIIYSLILCFTSVETTKETCRIVSCNVRHIWSFVLVAGS